MPMSASSVDSIDRVLEEAQTYGGDTRYVTHDAWTSYPATGFTFPNGRQITNGFDALYRKNERQRDTGGSQSPHWQFFGQAARHASRSATASPVRS